ncbi:MAG: hydrolase, partial [Acidimicrobiia bacterium]|nr:hydrolase [Acidimicrobiia bacterium]
MVGEDDLRRWSEALSGIARTGLAFTDNQYEQERFEEVLHVAADMAAALSSGWTPDNFVAEWMKSVGDGVPGYVTPKVAVGAVVGNDEGEILL